MKLKPVSQFLKLILVFSSVVAISATPVEAISPSEWIPGRIIEDELFTDRSSMSVQQIQDFLNSKVPNCDTWGNGTSPYWAPDYNGDGRTSRAEYGQYRGNPVPFTCLKDYREVPKTVAGGGIPPNNYGNVYGTEPAGSKSAAEIIWQAAQDFNISPKVLLVTLQKESGLITDDWTFRSQLVYAMGAYCPDTGPGGSANCNPDYGGFSLQIRESADLLRYYLNNMQQSWWDNKRPYQSNYIQYDVETSCGGSNVYMENKATTALYVYTPYQPSQAALNAGYGSAEPCGAYGNRNFWLYYNDWFGYSLRRPYAWKYVYQAAYPDLTFTSRLSTPLKLEAGQRVFMTLSALNNGSKPWHNSGTNPLRLGTTEPNDRVSGLCDAPSWIDCTRPALLTQGTVQPGEIGTFGFWVTAPDSVGYYKERFNIVAEGLTWLNDPGLYFAFDVIPTYKWELQSVDYYLDPSKTIKTTNGSLVAGEKSYVTLKVKNTGNVTWANDDTMPIRLATSVPQNRSSRLCVTSWLSCDRPARLMERNIAPGQVGTFSFEILNPKDPSLYGENFNLVIEGSRWMNDAKTTLWLGTHQRKTVWDIVSVSTYSDSTKQTPVNLLDISRGQKVFVSIVTKNNGNVLWTKDSSGVRMGTSRPRDHHGVLFDASWIDRVRTSIFNESSVQPGGTGTYEFFITAPITPGQYSESYELVKENHYWLDGGVVNLTLNVK